MIDIFPAKGFEELLNERMQAGHIESSPHNLQRRLHRLIQQINCLLESLILDECRICLLCGLHRSMAEQVLNVCVANSYFMQQWGSEKDHCSVKSRNNC